jgi:hypothetical protein
MTSRDLNDKQIAAIEARIVPMLRYLSRLSKRASAKWPPDDPLRQKIAVAHDSVYGLRIALHYLRVGLQHPTWQDRFGLPIPPPPNDGN